MNKQHVVAVLMRHNVTNVIAENLAKQHSSEQIMAQIRMLSYRNATDNPAGLLVKSIRENWAAPEAYLEVQHKHNAMLEERKRQAVKRQRLASQRKAIEKVKANLTKDELENLKQKAIDRVARIMRNYYGADNLPAPLINGVMNRIIKENYLDNPQQRAPDLLNGGLTEKTNYVTVSPDRTLALVV